MSIVIRHGLIDNSISSDIKIPSIILNDQVILTTAKILEGGNQQSKRFTNKQKNIVHNYLTKNQLIKVQEDKEFDFLNSIELNILYEKDKASRSLAKQKINLLYIFNCKNVQDCIQNIFENLYPNSSDQYSNQKLLLSSFCILHKTLPSSETKSYHVNVMTTIRKLLTYCRFLSPINKLDDVMTICTPFGMESFYKSVTIGKVSNFLGDNRCIFVISNALPGCEGSAVFNYNLRLIGILICSTLNRPNENFHLSLAASFKHIIRSFCTQICVQGSYKNAIRQYPKFKWEKSVVRIICNGYQGTGTFVKILDKKFILTCSHVLENKQQSGEIECQYIDGKIFSKIVWRNTKFNEPFDMAILSSPTTIPDDCFVRLSSVKPRLGQTIYNAGFPFFTNAINTEEKFTTPAFFDGKIIKSLSGLLVSDGTLQAGQSGGPMFDENYCLLGICISNLKLDNTIYPNINTSVPIFDIKAVLEEFAKTNDIRILDKLIASEYIRKIWNLESPYTISKL